MEEHNQELYDQLVNQIKDQGNLSGKDTEDFVRLHELVEINDEERAYPLIKKKIQRQRNDFRFQLSDAELKGMFEILEKKRLSEVGLIQCEYSFMSFIKRSLNIKSPTELPLLPEIQKIDISVFENLFVNNEHRSKLFKTFLQALINASEIYDLEILDVIVGGSFVGPERTAPKDVDFILVLPEIDFRRDFQGKKLKKIKPLEFENHLDINKLPENYDEKTFMAYDLLVLLGNYVEGKPKKNIKEIKYESRNLYQFSITKGEL